jgi:hypothetical protein
MLLNSQNYKGGQVGDTSQAFMRDHPSNPTTNPSEFGNSGLINNIITGNNTDLNRTGEQTMDMSTFYRQEEVDFEKLQKRAVARDRKLEEINSLLKQSEEQEPIREVPEMPAIFCTDNIYHMV